MTLTDERKVELLRKLGEEDPGRQWSRRELDAAILRLAHSLPAKDRNGIIRYHNNRNVPNAPLRKPAPVAPSPRDGRAKPPVPPPQEVEPTSPARSPSARAVGKAESSYQDKDLDQGWLGLALLTRMLQLGWRSRDWGELGLWRPVRGHGHSPSDRPGFARWVRGGGSGRYLLYPDALSQLFSAAGLNPERVMCDLADRGITETDAGHTTKVSWVEGGLRRMVVLPDRYVRNRAGRWLPSEVRLRQGRKTRARGDYG